MIPTTAYMQGKYGHNYDCRPHSRECDCETCNEWCEDWRQYEEMGTPERGSDCRTSCAYSGCAYCEWVNRAIAYYEYCLELDSDCYPFSNHSPTEYLEFLKEDQDAS